MNILKFALLLGKLKNVKRTGWINHSVPSPESVAEHSFRSAVLTMILAPKVGVDTNKATKMALIHDIAEAEIGDIVTRNGIEDLPNLQEKLIQERNAMESILSLIDEEECLALYDEFEEGKTKEARLVKQIDTLEMAIQAYEYEKKYKLNLQIFIDATKTRLTEPKLKEILEEILKLRN